MTCLLGNDITPVLAVMTEGLANVLLNVLLAFAGDKGADEVQALNANRHVLAPPEGY